MGSLRDRVERTTRHVRDAPHPPVGDERTKARLVTQRETSGRGDPPSHPLHRSRGRTSFLFFS